MTAIIMKILSAFMSIVVFLSGAFPALFGGKEYINPYGEEVYIGQFHYHYRPVVYDNYSVLIEVGNNPGCIVYSLPEKYDEEYFEENSLVIFSTERQHEDYRIWIKSVAEVGDTLEVEYTVITDGTMHDMLYHSYASEVIIETSKNIKNVELKESEIVVPFDVEYIDQDPFMLFRDGTYV